MQEDRWWRTVLKDWELLPEDPAAPAKDIMETRFIWNEERR